MRAKLIERLNKLPLDLIVSVHEAGLLGANVTQDKMQRLSEKAKQAGTRQKSMLVAQLLRANPTYVEQNIQSWEHAAGL